MTTQQLGNMRLYRFTAPGGTEIGALHWHDDTDAVEYARAILLNPLHPSIQVRRVERGGQESVIATVG